nr:uncharacterized protein LOC119624838 [Chlorocebus sabaeus]
MPAGPCPQLALSASSAMVSWTPACATRLRPHAGSKLPLLCGHWHYQWWIRVGPGICKQGRNSATLARAVPPPHAQIMNLTHPVVPGGSHPTETEDGLIDLKTEKLDMTCCEKSLCNTAAGVAFGAWLLGSSCSAWASSFGPCREPSPPWHCPWWVNRSAGWLPSAALSSCPDALAWLPSGPETHLTQQPRRPLAQTVNARVQPKDFVPLLTLGV